jgi:cytochrome c biogenesis protein CcmG/thiol:disulfide interchange protein DsbE
VDAVREPEPESADPVEGDDHGRVGYGRYARYTPLALALVIVAALFAIGVARHDPGDGNDTGQAGRLIGKPAPDVTLTLLDGSSLRLADLRGSVVALNFWASWCAPCETELPRFEAVAEEAARTGERVTIVGVGIKRDYDENARAMAADLGLTFPVGRDTAGADDLHGPIETAYGVSNYPTTVFVRPDGTVAAVHIGELSDEEIRDYLKQSGK